jgi:acyl-coenzyme A synthetase/AMP-(fatty) acid ligase
VLLLSDENLEKLLIWLGAWRIGAVVCPFNLEINAKQMVELTAALHPALIVYHKDIDVAAIVGNAAALRIKFGAWSATGTRDPQDEFFAMLSPGDPAQLPERNQADDTACIFCTSGTTAKPKIVIYDHAAYWLNGLDTVEFLGLTERDRTLEYRSFGWNSAQVLSLLPFLQRGLTLHIAKKFSHSRFFDWVQQHGITFSAGVPTVLNMLLNKPLGFTAQDIPTLRLMSCSTAPLTAQQWVQFEEMYGVTLLQLYGMSETGWVCGNRHYRKKMGTVGPPALHQELKIVDAAGDECPVDVEGEITVGGPQMAIGYLTDDGAIEPVRGKRIKTGDLGIKDAEGFIRVTGRSKDLIIRGGVNIAPLEIDEVLIKHPRIAEAAAVGVPDKIYGEEVVCYVVAKDRSLTDVAVLQHCAVHLPPAKTPKQVIIVPELPKSERGKVLRDKLRENWLARAKVTA